MIYGNSEIIFHGNFQGGMKQRAALIRTLALNPDILLLDESFSGLDFQTRLTVTDDIYKIIKKENKTAILVTHDISEAISLADTVAVLSHRPTTIQSVHQIHLTLDGEKTPFNARTAPEFQHYFDLFWKELQNDEKDSKGSAGYLSYLKNIKKEARHILWIQLLSCLIFLILWEVAATIGWIDDFFVSKPSAIWFLLIKYIETGEIFRHIGISLFETLIGLVIGTIGGLFIAICLWWSDKLAKIFDPFLVVLNALPKTALAPILIVWVGASMKGIIVIAVITSITVTIMSAYNYFVTVDPDKIKLMQSFGANKWQILTKLILPANGINMINLLKINIGMTWVGVIVGEFIASKAGIGYLIVYGDKFSN